MDIPCPSCRKRLTLPKEALGKLVKCSECGTVFTAIVFSFIFGLTFSFGVVVNLIALTQPGDFLGLILFSLMGGAITTSVNLISAIYGIAVLNDAAVRRLFRDHR
jgi:LSD1 subclass zinc finger protein